jgi:hypothetical protein
MMSCSDSFLELDNPAALTYDKFYQTEADFQSALNGCYYNLKTIPRYLLTFNETTTDNAYLHIDDGTYQENQYDKLIVSSNSMPVQNFWRDSYKAIASANMVISRIDRAQAPAETQKVFVAEAKFIRALCYFNMVRVFGGVPVHASEITDFNDAYNVGRSSVDEVYAFIIQDLTDAQNIDSDRSAAQRAVAGGKANSTAVKALLGKVYMAKRDYANAVTALTGVIGKGYSLLNEPADLYNPETPINNEVIFAINYERVDGQNNLSAFNFLPKYSQGILPLITGSDNGDGMHNIEDALVASFDPADKRLTQLIGTFESKEEKFFYTKKYLDLGATPTANNSASDFIFLRYADVLLMMADALNQSDKTGDAYQYVNAVRARAGLGNLPTGLTKAQMNDALAQERQKEFLCEGDRWFDLSFRGFDYLKSTLNAVLPTSHTPSAVVKDHMNLFPIPGDQVNLKPGVLEQNPGY